MLYIFGSTTTKININNQKKGQKKMKKNKADTHALKISHQVFAEIQRRKADFSEKGIRLSTDDVLKNALGVKNA